MPTRRTLDDVSFADIQEAERAGAYADRQTLAKHFNVSLEDAAELLALQQSFRELAATAALYRRRFQ